MMDSNIVELCVCGHCKDRHAMKGEGMCREYLYGNFDMKCTCPCYAPFMTLSRDEDILNLTDELSQPYLEEPLDT